MSRFTRDARLKRETQRRLDNVSRFDPETGWLKTRYDDPLDRASRVDRDDSTLPTP